MEIRKAYKRLALSNHPDKVPEAEREAAEVRFKVICEAYEVLSDDAERARYDQFGHVDANDWQDDYHENPFGPDDFAQFFGFDPRSAGGRGGPGRGGPGRGAHKHAGGRTPDEEIELDATLEDVYKGRVYKMASARDVLCSLCKGSGAKKNAKPRTCVTCKGEGHVRKLRRLAPGLVTNDTVLCDSCHGRGTVVRDKDQCRKCKGSGTTEEKTMLEVYVPRGARQGHKIVLEGKADEAPGKTAGDLVFRVNVAEHDVFERRGEDLVATISLTLAEALTGFSRVVLQHLDGRGIKLTVPAGQVTRPGEYLKVSGEGMPRKGTDARGDLYLKADVEFPENGWCLETSELATIKNVLPSKPRVPLNISPKEVDDVDYLKNATLPDDADDRSDADGPSDGEYDYEPNGPECTTV